MSVIPKEIYRFSAAPIKISVFFVEIEKFVQKLEKLYPSIQYVNRFTTHSWGQKVVRFYDLDGNLIEVGTPM